ncbi:MAG: amidase [Betaproteobacteria bacterium]
MQDALPFRSLQALSGMLARSECSSRELVAACLDRIRRLDGHLHAFIDVYAEEALACAEAADLERRAGMTRSPLHGLPIALKDLMHLAGRVTTAGSRTWEGRLANDTAVAAQRLLAAGMIVLGKTHMVEFAFGGWGRNAPMGTPWNPWDTGVHRVPGGSSSGSAVAVAAGLAPAAIGSDTGGSIRIPAALTNLTGLKPTYGTISLAGVVPLSRTLDSLGPLTHTADDAALLMIAMMGFDADDERTWHRPEIDFRGALKADLDLRGCRIAALAVEAMPASTLPDVLRIRAETITVLRDRGATVEEVVPPVDFEDVMRRNGRLIATEAYAFHRGKIEDEALPLDPWVRQRLLSGQGISAADYIDEMAAKTRSANAFAQWMRGRDALLTPTLPITATPVTEVDESGTALATFTRAANYLGACALSFPAGFSGDGLPIGMQVIGGPFADASLVRIGRAFQAVTSWHEQRPDLSAWGDSHAGN